MLNRKKNKFYRELNLPKDLKNLINFYREWKQKELRKINKRRIDENNN